MFVILIYNI